MSNGNHEAIDKVVIELLHYINEYRSLKIALSKQQKLGYSQLNMARLYSKKCQNELNSISYQYKTNIPCLYSFKNGKIIDKNNPRSIAKNSNNTLRNRLKNDIKSNNTNYIPPNFLIS